jgi:hypothetical protein
MAIWVLPFETKNEHYLSVYYLCFQNNLKEKAATTLASPCARKAWWGNSDLVAMFLRKELAGDSVMRASRA